MFTMTGNARANRIAISITLTPKATAILDSEADALGTTRSRVIEKLLRMSVAEPLRLAR